MSISLIILLIFQEAKVPINEEHISELIKTLDQDDDGEIDFRYVVFKTVLFIYLHQLVIIPQSGIYF